MQNIGGPVKDMSSIFEEIVRSGYVRGSEEPFRILVYNGDADLARSPVQAEFFIENLASLMGARVSDWAAGGVNIHNIHGLGQRGTTRVSLTVSCWRKNGAVP